MTTTTQQNVLLIEDNPLLVDAYTTALESKKYTVHTTSNGSTGIKLSKRIKPKLILLDLAIHGTQGLLVLEELKKHPDTEDIPVIILTSNENPKDKEKAESLLVDGYYSKAGTSLESLVTYVEKAVAGESAHGGSTA